MNEEPKFVVAEPVDVLQLAKAIRFILGCVVFGTSTFTLQANTKIRINGQMIKDMLGENPDLPWLTRFCMEWQMTIRGLSLLVLVICVVQLFSKNVIRSIYIVTILALLIVAEAALVTYAMDSPILEILKRLNGGPGLP